MINYDDTAFAECKKWIVTQINQGHKWEDVVNLTLDGNDPKMLFRELKEEILIVPPAMSFSEWHHFAQYVQSQYASIVSLFGLDDGKSNTLPAPTSTESPWTRYKKYLQGVNTGKPKMSPESVAMLENNCHWIVNHLSRDTRSSGAVKGLVMGGVQSGKTANMIGVMAMAAHYDWNIFIVLSGTIDNLRKQTRDRVYSDLSCTAGVKWHVLEPTADPLRMRDMMDNNKIIMADDLKLNTFQDGHSNRQWLHRYVFVCLKNSTRLRRLNDWLHSNYMRVAKMRVLIIDDEADQASINTVKMETTVTDPAEIERTAVNQLIINLVRGYSSTGVPARIEFQAMNYISFTATPYANVLNEAYRDSLYPSNFICCLPESKEYFGPKVIWGSKSDERYPGINILREIEKDEMEQIKLLNAGSTNNIPQSMKKAIGWFLCAAAILRIRNHKKPISMLIHTTALQRGHFEEYNVIRKWLNTSKVSGELMQICRMSYSDEKDEFRLKDLREGYPDYARMSDVNDEFPDFKEIQNEIEDIIGEITNIQFDDTKSIMYSSGIHLCVDNCSANRIAEEGTHLRIIYPSASQLNEMKKAPVFIVMGGNTLARGLTLEGLVCTYFARNVNQADTLLQMARWFGYMHGYELLQRVWMSEQVMSKFSLIEEIDELLRREFDDFMQKGKSPSMFGPRIMSSSKIAKFLLTSKNKSQNMITADVDFAGDSYEITAFENNDDGLNKNIQITENFLRSLGLAEKSDAIDGTYVWRDVDTQNVISNFLKKYTIFECSSLSKDIPIFIDWIKQNVDEGKFLHWNVAVAGDKKSSSRWIVSGADVGKIERSKKRKSKYIDIGSLRSGRDILADIKVSELSRENIEAFKAAKRSGKGLIPLRYKVGLGETPLLLLYRIDKDKGNETTYRAKIGSNYDIIGFSIVIAGEEISNDYVKTVTVRITE